jgi:CHAT domain-containing protein
MRRPPLGLARLVLGALLGLGLLAHAIAGGSAVATQDQPRQLLDRGVEAAKAGDLVTATRYWSDVIAICRIRGDTGTEAEALGRRGEAYEALGHFHLAVADLREGLKLAAAARSAVQEAVFAGALGNVLFQARRLAEAEPLLQRSIATARSANHEGALAASLNNVGNLYVVTDRGDLAAAAYRDADAAARRAGDEWTAITARTNLARVLLRQGGLTEGLMEIEEILVRLNALGNEHRRGTAMIASGRVAHREVPDSAPAEMRRRATGLAYAAYRAAALAAEAGRDSRTSSLGLGFLGELYEREGRRDEAYRLGSQAIFAAQKANAPDLIYRWEWLHGRLLRFRGDLAEAAAAYRRAYKSLQSVRTDIPVEYRDGTSSFRETLGPLYFEYADVLLQLSRTKGQSRGSNILEEARSAVETLKEAELRDYFRDGCIGAANSRQVTVERVGQRTAAIYPIVLPDRLELLVSLPDGIQQVTVPVKQSLLTEEVRRFRLLVEKRTTRQFVPAARQLYDWLIRPIRAELHAKGIETLVFVPDGALRTVPFAALMDGETYLAEQFSIAIAPGLTLIDPQPLTRKVDGRFLLAALSEPVQGYPGLPGVEREMAAVSQAYAGKTLFNQAFQASVFEREVKQLPYAVIHIASHGEFGSTPEETFLLTYDGKLTLDALEAAVKNVETRTGPIELLTLSACRTAAGDDRAALGLAGIAIKAGARAALASLWFISDEASSDLVAAFYNELGRGTISKAVALQKAQLKLLGDRRYRHPAYWASFLIIGNWL